MASHRRLTLSNGKENGPLHVVRLPRPHSGYPICTYLLEVAGLDRSYSVCESIVEPYQRPVAMEERSYHIAFGAYCRLIRDL